MTAPELDTYPITIYLSCRDLRRSIEFYREKLGFQIKECWPDEEKPMFASLRIGKQAVLLGAHMPPEEAGKWCGDDQKARELFQATARDFEANKPGAGVMIYLAVDDVDAYHETLRDRGLELIEPTTQFYGQRDFPLEDPEGYRLCFYMPVKMESCQSCGMPLAEAKPGQMYCHYCQDEYGKLKPYEAVLEGTIQGYFIAMQKMERPEAEQAAKEHLAKMPAWTGRD
ncbi:MAG: VOC family protein [Planctomycetota bacterium]